MKKILFHTTLVLLCLTSVWSCRYVDEYAAPFDNVVYIDAAMSSPYSGVTFNNTIDELEKQLAAQLSYPEEQDVSVVFRIEPDLVKEYNHRHGTDYTMLDESYFSMPEVETIIHAGKVISDPVTIFFTGLKELEIDASYLVPVTIVSASNISFLNSSRTVWLVVKRSSAITTAGRLMDKNWINFPTLDEESTKSAVFNGLRALTYECLIRFQNWDGHKDISSIMGVEQYCLLRIGDTNFNRQQIQFDGSGKDDKSGGPAFGKFPGRDNSKALSAGEWYHIAATCDLETRIVSIYVNGKLQSEGTEMTPDPYDGVINLAMRSIYDGQTQSFPSAYQFFIGRSYDETRPMRGDISEARVWSVARTQEQIFEYMYSVPEPETDPTLIGYWKFNEGEGNIIKDWSGNGNDGVSELDIEWPANIEIPIFNQ